MARKTRLDKKGKVPLLAMIRPRVRIIDQSRDESFPFRRKIPRLQYKEVPAAESVTSIFRK